MRYLIDGYNVMHAGGLLQSLPNPRGKARPDAFRKARNKFLGELAATIDATEAYQTTIVFDAADARKHLPHTDTHKGLSILFAFDHESADDRIEELLKADSNVKNLTVVSSDNRIRVAATRRGAKALSADDYWTRLDDLKARAQSRRSHPELQTRFEPAPEEVGRARGLSGRDSEYWNKVFADVAEDPLTHEELTGGVPLLTEAELARIAREVEEETL